MWKRLSILIACLALLAIGLHAIQAQDDTELPPRIVEVWPFSGIEISPYETLVVTFDQPMNHMSVEDAFSIDPVVPGTFFWSDRRTVQFTPEVPWAAAATYTVSIDSTARAENNLTLESPYQFEVNTAPPLQIISSSPEPSTTDVEPRGIRILVSFDRPVVALSPTTELSDLPTPLTIDPAMTGEGEWINTFIYSFQSTGWQKGGTEYTVDVPAGLTAVDGSVMGESYTWTFTTAAPHVQYVRLKNGQNLGLLDTEIEVYFSQPMDTTSTETAFSMFSGEQKTNGTFRWNDSLDSLTFIPDQHLALDTSYSVLIQPTARGREGGNLDDPFVFDFKTVPYPAVRATSPANDESEIFQRRQVSLDFSTVMNTETFRNRIIISPEPEEWLPEVTDYADYTRLTLSFDQVEGTTYTVTLLAGAEDIYGNAIQDDYVLTFSTSPPYEAPPTLDMSGYGWPRIVGAYNADTQVPIRVKGPVEVNYSLYQVDLENLARDTEYRTAMIRTWAAEYEESSAIEQINVPLASDRGGALAPGLYELEMVWQVVGDDHERTSTYVLAVANAAITVKDTEGKDLIWVTDMVTSQPIADALVTIYGHDGILTSGRTDADGVFLPEVDLTMDAVVTGNASNLPQEHGLTSYIVVEDTGLYGMWTNSLELKNPTSIAYLYTDRPVYRPGEQVYFRGIIRDRVDMDFSVPDTETVQITAGYYDDSSLFASSLTVSEFGTFSGAIQLPDDLQTGTYYIRLVDFNAPSPANPNDYPFDWDAYWYLRQYFLNQVEFEVADFRVPEYKIGVTAEQEEIVQGEPITFWSQAQYYAGGPVNNARVEWSTFAEAFTFEYTGPTQYSFYDSTLNHSVNDLDRYRQETTDTGEDGHYSFTTDQTIPENRVPVRLTASATISDESGIPISGTADVLLHPADVYVGLRSISGFGAMGKPVEIEIITVTPNSELQPEQVVNLEVVEVRWENQPIANQYGRYTREYEEIPVTDAQIITGADGTANYVFSAPNAGTYRVRAVTQDAQGRTNSSTLQIYVVANDATQVDWGQAHYSYRYGNHGLVMASDQESYKPGETAEIFIANPLGEPVTALISMERAGVMNYDVVEVTGSSLVYSLPIEHEYAPAVHVHVVLVRGVSEENPNPAYLMNSLRLTVEPVARRLNVTITPSTEQTAPGETLTFDVCVTDYDNRPVQAELGLALVDEAVLALKPPNSISLEDRFYSPNQPDYVWTTTSISAVLNTTSQQGESMGMGGGDGTYDPIPSIRDDFVYTPLWAPHVVTGEDGCASASLTMPDNLTTWRLDARIVTPDMKVAQTETGIVSFIPLMIRPTTPRFFIVGDRVRLDALVNNYTGSDQTVETTLFAEGVQIDGEVTQTVQIKKDNRALVSWWVTVEDVDGVDLTFAATSTEGYHDAAKPALRTGPGDTIPVYPNTTPDIVGTSGVLFTSDSRLELINVPPNLGDLDGTLTVRLEPSLAVAITDALRFLKICPHRGIEQTVSRFLPAIVTFRATQDLNISGWANEAELRDTVNTALEQLVMAQNDDGGWGWFDGMESSGTTTAYALYGLIEARNAGFYVDEDMFDDAVEFLIDHWVQPKVNTPGWELNQQAFQLYALAHAGYFDLDRYNALLDKRLKMSHTGRAYMIMTAHTAMPEEPALTNALVNDLVSAAILSATGTHWENMDSGWASNTRTTAVVLKALLQVDPDNPLLPNVVNWLMAARQGDPWRTTQENAWAILALTDWMVMTGELESDYAYRIRLNQDTLAQGTFTPDSSPDSWFIPTQDLALDRANALMIGRGEGSGALYYTAHLDLALPLSDAEPIDRGIAVQRHYYSPRKVSLVPSTEPVPQGEVVLVRLNFTLTRDVYFFVLEDPLPSGAEIADPVLMTTDPALAIFQRNDVFWYWETDYIDHVEMRDNQMNLYADFLPRGSYTFTYAITLTTIGEFQVLPAYAYAFYSPEVFGRSRSDVFIVSEQAPIVPSSGQG
jgi:uncharacterized protein YfaS (alpha-2-macroglobulin family)